MLSVWLIVFYHFIRFIYLTNNLPDILNKPTVMSRFYKARLSHAGACQVAVMVSTDAATNRESNLDHPCGSPDAGHNTSTHT